MFNNEKRCNNMEVKDVWDRRFEWRRDDDDVVSPSELDRLGIKVDTRLGRINIIFYNKNGNHKSTGTAKGHLRCHRNAAYR